MKASWLLLAGVLAGILLAGSADAATVQCSSCSDCTSKIAGASSGDTVQLTQSIYNYAGGAFSACIEFNGKDSVIFDCLGNTIDGDDAGSDFGIRLSESNGGSVNGKVRNCVVSDFYIGVDVYTGYNNTLENIASVSNNYSGIVLESTWNDTVNNANVSMSHGGFGLDIQNCSYVNISGITSNNNPLSHGVFMMSTNNSVLKNITSNWNSFGFWLFYNNNNTFDGINASYNSQKGMLVAEDSSYNRFSNLTLLGNYYDGFNMQSSTWPCSYNTIRDSHIEGNANGIYLLAPAGSSVFSRLNSFYNNYLNNTLNLYSNNAGNQPNYWSTAKDCSKKNIIGGQCIGGNFWTNNLGTIYPQPCNDADSNGLCDSSYEPSTGNIDYLPLKISTYNCTSCSDCTNKIAAASSGDIVQLVSPIANYVGTFNSGCIQFASKANITFDCLGNMIDGDGSGSHHGMTISDANGKEDNLIIRNCPISDFWLGLEIVGSSNNTIMNTSTISNMNTGMFIINSANNNSLINVTVKSNPIGVSFVTDQNNVLQDSTISSNSNYGILISNSSSNMIRNSHIENNTASGIYFQGGNPASLSRYNLVYNNYFNNSKNFYSNDINNTNYLNKTLSSGPNILGGPWIGGNYWTSPGGNYSDICADSNGDSLCDQNYTLDGNNTDNLALTFDRTPPTLTVLAPANATQTSLTYILINASANEPLGACRLEWAGANETMNVQGSYCWLNKTSLTNMTYAFRVYASDSAGIWNVTDTIYATVNFTQVVLPQVNPLALAYSISQQSIGLGNSTTITMNASSNNSISRIILNITLPNGTAISFQYSDNATLDYVPPIQGLYNITITANDSLGYGRMLSDNFSASQTVLFNSTVTSQNGTGIKSKIELYYPGTGIKLSEFQSDTGSFRSKGVLAQNYDITFKSYDERFQATLKNVNITQNLNKAMSIDNPTAQGFAITYAVNNSYGFSGAVVRMKYSGLEDDHIGLYKCADWDFQARHCDGDWVQVPYSQDKGSDYVTFNSNSFSAFGLLQEPYCGDGICQPDETTDSCSQDCTCVDGDKMSCGSSVGECRKGNRTCSSGMWGACTGGISPKNESCNGKDDDCNGVIDDNLTQSCGSDVGECKAGIQTCSAGAWGSCSGEVTPAAETCNGKDDDCDGMIDNGGDCCTNDDTRACGTTSDKGACHPGISTCKGGTWSECSGYATATPEVCDDGIDNDCNGLTDSNDPACFQTDCSNGVMDGNETGVDCGGACKDCPDSSMVWISISAIGAVILGVLAVLYFLLRKQGKELTWEELQRKWS